MSSEVQVEVTPGETMAVVSENSVPKDGESSLSALEKGQVCLDAAIDQINETSGLPITVSAGGHLNRIEERKSTSDTKSTESMDPEPTTNNTTTTITTTTTTTTTVNLQPTVPPTESSISSNTSMEKRCPPKSSHQSTVIHLCPSGGRTASLAANNKGEDAPNILVYKKVTKIQDP